MQDRAGGASISISSPKDTNFTSEDRCIHSYDPETKRQPSHSGKKQQPPRSQRACKVRNTTKSKLVVFFGIHRAVHHEIVPQDQTVKAEHYSDVLTCLRENIQYKQPDCGAGNRPHAVPIGIGQIWFPLTFVWSSKWSLVSSLQILEPSMRTKVENCKSAHTSGPKNT